MDFIEGEILAFDKPYRWTSFDVVGKTRWMICRHLKLKKLKVGHTGTLDPLATGVVVVCTGKKTKLIEQLQNHDKQYIATLQLGATTPSFDLEKPIDQHYPTEHIDLQLIEQTLPRFVGDIQQIPPIFSAVKVDGKRAYSIARQGQQAELKAKDINISRLQLLDFNADTMQLTLDVTCSKGTYIRALARDIGLSLGSGAHLIALRRTRLGNTTIDNCITFQQLQDILDNNVTNSTTI